MADDKNKNTNELGKNELGEVSGGSKIIDLMKKPLSPFAEQPMVKYGCPIPRPPKEDEKNEEINNELNPLPDNNEQDSNK